VSLTAIARITFPGLHAWANQPADAPRRYLHTPHRHLFHVEIGVPVNHGDREVEILALGGAVRSIVEAFGRTSDGDIDLGARSCEHLAEYIGARIAMLAQAGCDVAPPSYVRVFEDNENGAEWRP
jgi:hypothetical protein